MDVIRFDLLEAVRPVLLVRFLRPFASYLATRSIELDDVEFDANWLEALHRTLNAVDSGMPPELQHALIEIADLTSEGAHEQVLALAHQQQLNLFTVNPRTTPEELAFAVYLDRRDVFQAAHAQTRSREVRRFVEFVGKDASPPKANPSGGRRTLLARRLGDWFGERNRTAFCDVRVVETNDLGPMEWLASVAVGSWSSEVKLHTGHAVVAAPARGASWRIHSVRRPR